MKPNLFILGAGKCGTTSLHEILAQHQDIHASSPKEPTFFSWPFQKVRNPIRYFKLFDSPKPYRMESSHVYLTNVDTAQVLRDLFPEARFLVILRDPKARAYSLYRHMRGIGRKGRVMEKIQTFADAIRAEDKRYASTTFFKTCDGYFWNFLYCRSSRFDEQLARYFNLFDRRQFHILTLAQFSKEPVSTIQEILKFLELDAGPAQHFDYAIRNRRRGYEPYDSVSDALMDKALGGVTGRTDDIVGRKLDWTK